MPTIQEKIAEYKAAGDNETGLRLRRAAVKAIYGGFGSPDWYYYMSHFASSPKQLRRLCSTETDCHENIPASRAYLAGNGVCLPGTWTTFGDGIEHWLDVTLDDYVD